MADASIARRTSPVLVIAGPTASGKSALADRVARELATEVISADAMQVYRGMDIGTAKTPPAERAVPLRMVDVVEPYEEYSAALFQRDARAEVDRLLGCGKTPILCGGTGLYIKAVIDAMEFPAGEVESTRRRAYQDMAFRLGAKGIHDELARRDPESAACIHPHNTRRVIRALEMLDEGERYADRKERFSQPQPYYRSLQFALTMHRERLNRRIDTRVDLMIEQGLVDEVKRLVECGAGDAITSRQAIGYKEIMDALDGALSMDEAIELIKLRSRRYAKRQLSWFRRDERIVWIDMDRMSESEAAELVLCWLEEAH